MNKSIEVLKKFQDWRTGKDERTMKEAGIHPSDITAAIDDVIGMHNEMVRIIAVLLQLHEADVFVKEPWDDSFNEAKKILEKTK